MSESLSSAAELPTIAVDMRALVGTPSGIGFFTSSMLRQLASRRTARFRGLAHRPISDFDRLQAAGVQLESQTAPSGVWWQQLVLPRRLAESDIDLFWSPIMTLPTRLPVPGVVTIHDLTTLTHPRTHRLKVRLSIRPFLASTVRMARQIAVDSKATAQDLRSFFPASIAKIEVVYPGIDEDFVPGTGTSIAAHRQRLGCPDGYVLYAGTLEPRKNLPALLDAWLSLRQDTPDTPTLVLVGPYGWRSRGLLARIEMLQDSGLRYLGHVERSRLVRLIQAASVFVYPSLAEGFGLPVAEAMSCGVPVIASHRSSLPEVVGDAGLLVDPTEPRQLVAALRRVLSEPSLASDLGERGRERARLFTWDRAAGEMEELFRRALR